MKTVLWILSYCSFIVLSANTLWADLPISEATSECMDCHTVIHPGIVQDWQSSRHAKITPKSAMAVKGLSQKVSSEDVPANLRETVIGCAECHMLRPGKHEDTFEHNGYDIHVVVSPDDCSTCHTKERTQYAHNPMSHAYDNLASNAVYQKLEQSIIGTVSRNSQGMHFKPADATTRAETCYYCHGTRLKVVGVVSRETELAGELEFPVIEGWPNQGVGRINLDGSMGSCTACHTRHTFSIEMARKPHTCKECHIGPDVPAYKVFTASKHGNIFSSHHDSWKFDKVPWTIGKDFKAPTCAACHISLLVNTEEELVVKRTHQMTDRLPWRIFGLIYAHPQPKNPDTSGIRNKDGLPLPTAFDGSFAANGLIDAQEQANRRKNMQAACLNCHDLSWVNEHWQRMEHTIQKSNHAVHIATSIMQDAWQAGLANPTANPFDEYIEKKWTDTWQFYANTIRFSSAMSGGGDYSVYAGGYYQLSQTILEMSDWLKLHQSLSQTQEK